MRPVPTTERDTQRDRATALNLHGLLAHWGEVASETWVTSLLGWEEHENIASATCCGALPAAWCASSR